MNADDTYLFLERAKKKNEMLDREETEMKTGFQSGSLMAKRHKAIEKLNSGDDFDADNISDDIEINAGLHDLNNVPLHKPLNRMGPTTPGSAFVSSSTGMIRFGYDNSMVDLEVKGSPRVIGHVHKMKEPRPISLKVDFGNKHTHTNKKGGYSIDMPDIYPERYRMGDGKMGGILPNLNISGVLGRMDGASKKHSQKMNEFTKKYASKHTIGGKEAKHDVSDINDLSKRLSNFVHGQKSKPKKVSFSGLDLGTDGLNFEVVGIKKKKGGGII